mmetsp:Transcript_7978/g.28467  ORF Transcript_7978/g.28467 Transcript_7978/m.28467 type:complete len:218 (+) Transcript_7978:901-1554(+)
MPGGTFARLLISAADTARKVSASPYDVASGTPSARSASAATSKTDATDASVGSTSSYTRRTRSFLDARSRWPVSHGLAPSTNRRRSRTLSAADRDGAAAAASAPAASPASSSREYSVTVVTAPTYRNPSLLSSSRSTTSTPVRPEGATATGGASPPASCAVAASAPFDSATPSRPAATPSSPGCTRAAAAAITHDCAAQAQAHSDTHASDSVTGTSH